MSRQESDFFSCQVELDSSKPLSYQHPHPTTLIFFCAGGIDLNNGGSTSAHLDWNNKSQMEEWKRNCEWVLDWMKKNNEAERSVGLK